MNYNTQHLTVEQKIQLMKDAKERCFRWWVDKLDCKVSLQRKTINVPFGQAITRLSNWHIFSVIHRTFSENHFEVSFRANDGDRELFLWILVEPENFDELLKKYNLVKKDV